MCQLMRQQQFASLGPRIELAFVEINVAAVSKRLCPQLFAQVGGFAARMDPYMAEVSVKACVHLPKNRWRQRLSSTRRSGNALGNMMRDGSPSRILFHLKRSLLLVMAGHPLLLDGFLLFFPWHALHVDSAFLFLIHTLHGFCMYLLVIADASIVGAQLLLLLRRRMTLDDPADLFPLYAGILAGLVDDSVGGSIGLLLMTVAGGIDRKTGLGMAGFFWLLFGPPMRKEGLIFLIRSLSIAVII